jgi:hypothetical protein
MTNMSNLRLWAALVLALAAALDVSAAAFSSYRETNQIAVTDKFLLSGTNRASGARQITATASNILESMKSFPNWPASGAGDVTTAQLNTASNTLNSALVANDTTTSNALRSDFIANDTTTSNGLVSLYGPQVAGLTNIAVGKVDESAGVLTNANAWESFTAHGTSTFEILDDDSAQANIYNEAGTNAWIRYSSLDGASVVRLGFKGTNDFALYDETTSTAPFLWRRSTLSLHSRGAFNIDSLRVTNGVTLPSLSASRAVVLNASGDLTNATTTAAEIEHVAGVTSAIQTQLDSKVAYTGTPGTISNVNAIIFAAHSPAITTSNLFLSFDTNLHTCIGLTNLVLTNWQERATGSDDMNLFVHNTTAVTMGIVWPAYGAQHGYWFGTNANNDVLSSTSIASGGRRLISVKRVGTNLFPTITTW